MYFWLDPKVPKNQDRIKILLKITPKIALEVNSPSAQTNFSLAIVLVIFSTQIFNGHFY